MAAKGITLQEFVKFEKLSADFEYESWEPVRFFGLDFYQNNFGIPKKIPKKI